MLKAEEPGDPHDDRLAEIPPGLARLRLSPRQIDSLKKQGFVSREDRGQGRIYHKLRFRHGGRQAVRYIGRDADAAARVQRELDELQKVSRLDREMSRLQTEARAAMREAKAALAPFLAGTGFAFHGHAVRKTRDDPLTSPADQEQPFCPLESNAQENQG